MVSWRVYCCFLALGISLLGYCFAQGAVTCLVEAAFATRQRATYSHCVGVGEAKELVCLFLSISGKQRTRKVNCVLSPL